MLWDDHVASTLWLMRQRHGEASAVGRAAADSTFRASGR